MARYNEILVGRFARAVQKLFGMKGEVPIGSLAGELSVIHPLLNGVENRYLEGWDRFASATVVAAVAANLGGVRLRNPLGSNVIAVIERISFSTGGQDRPALRMAQGVTVDLGTIQGIGSNNIDARGRVGATLIASFQASAATVPAMSANQFTLDAPNLLANTTLIWTNDENHELTLLPGQGLQFEAGTINELISFSALWRERFLEDSERT